MSFAIGDTVGLTASRIAWGKVVHGNRFPRAYHANLDR
jgi:hypothetical protein